MRSGTNEFERARGVIGPRIRELRKTRGLSQEQLADLAGCDRTYVGMLERQQGNPSLSVLAAVANALGTTVHQLLADT